MHLLPGFLPKNNNEMLIRHLHSNQGSGTLMERKTHILMENPERDPHKYTQLIFEKGAEAIRWKRESLFSEWFGYNWTPIRKESSNLDLCFTFYTKFNSEWIIGFNVKHKTL